ncbi:MAG: hypothetical protein F6J93_14210 [Oscillatoria sp. SIO1A7]|nr:hypothetical protein [Oscillatoria sp. SIO1A7]
MSIPAMRVWRSRTRESITISSFFITPYTSYILKIAPDTRHDTRHDTRQPTADTTPHTTHPTPHTPHPVHPTS